MNLGTLRIPSDNSPARISANVLFYSNNCDGSKILISMMEKENLIKYFLLICTDNNNKIPTEIKVTPTLIIKGNSNLYVAGDAFSWFAKVKQWKIQMVIQRMADGQKQYIQTNSGMNNMSESNVLGFNKTEMEGMSDMFAFILTDENIPHSHFDYNNIGKDNIFYVSNESKDTLKISESTQSKLTSNLEAERNKQDKIIKQQIDGFIKNYSK